MKEKPTDEMDIEIQQAEQSKSSYISHSYINDLFSYKYKKAPSRDMVIKLAFGCPLTWSRRIGF